MTRGKEIAPQPRLVPAALKAAFAVHQLAFSFCYMSATAEVQGDNSASEQKEEGAPEEATNEEIANSPTTEDKVTATTIDNLTLVTELIAKAPSQRRGSPLLVLVHVDVVRLEAVLEKFKVCKHLLNEKSRS